MASSSSSSLALIAFLLIATTSFSQLIVPSPPPPVNLPPVVGPPIRVSPRLVPGPPLRFSPTSRFKIFGVISCSSVPLPSQRPIGPATVTLICRDGRPEVFPPVRATEKGYFEIFVIPGAVRRIDLSKCALFTGARGRDCPALKAGEVFRAELGQSFTTRSGMSVGILSGPFSPAKL